MKENDTSQRRINHKPEGMELQQLLSLIRDNWYWFVLAGFLGLLGALLMRPILPF
jgi:uncharacterized protein involved in exopolysaccharide biosynthesis